MRQTRIWCLPGRLAAEHRVKGHQLQDVDRLEVELGGDPGDRLVGDDSRNAPGSDGAAAAWRCAGDGVMGDDLVDLGFESSGGSFHCNRISLRNCPGLGRIVELAVHEEWIDRRSFRSCLVDVHVLAVERLLRRSEERQFLRVSVRVSAGRGWIRLPSGSCPIFTQLRFASREIARCSRSTRCSTRPCGAAEGGAAVM